MPNIVTMGGSGNDVLLNILTNSLTAEPEDVLIGKLFVGKNSNNILSGQMVNNGAVNQTFTPSTSVQTYTIPEGYHDGTGQITVGAISTQTKTQAAGTSNITVSADSGKYLTSVTVTPTPTETKSVTPTASAQTVTPSTGKHLSSVTVNAVSLTGDAVAANVLSGKTFYNTNLTKVTGTMVNKGAITQTITAGGSYTIPAGYHNGSGKVTASVPGVKFVGWGDYLQGNSGTTDKYSSVLDTTANKRSCSYTLAVYNLNHSDINTTYIQGSNNNSSWVDLDNVSVNTPYAREYKNGSNSSYRYYRIRHYSRLYGGWSTGAISCIDC